jgi:prepilin-type N-terminal cleavage/methylation domain-containing protein
VRAPARAAGAGCRGFSFLELLVVMGAMAVLMGLSVGYLSSIGSATQLDQARGILVETCRRGLSASVGGGRRTVVTVSPRETSEGATVLRVSASIAQPVVTHQFEGLDQVSGGLAGRAQGVTIARGQGYTGSAGLFARGGSIDYGRQSAFAMTEGFELDVRLRPEGNQQEMVLVEGLGDEGTAIYRVALVRGTSSGDDYDVEVRLRVRRPGESARESTGTEATYRTSGGPLRAGGPWQRVEVAWHGLDATVRVNGLDIDVGDKGRSRRGGGLDETTAGEVRALASPASGLVSMSISSAGRSYVGLMDTFRLRGVFRSSEMQRDLPEALIMMSPAPPVRLVFENGALDPEVHARGVVMRFTDTQKPDDLPLSVIVGMNGAVESRQEAVATETERRGAAGPGDAADRGGGR